MRVCIFGSEIGLVKKDVFVGGSTVSAVRLAQALHLLGDEVFILSSAPRGRPSCQHSFMWGSITNKKMLGRYLSIPYLACFGLFSFFDLLKFCKINNVDVINTHAGTFFLHSIPSLVGKILGIPVIHTQYCELTFTGNNLRNLCTRSFVRFCSNLPAHFCGISVNVCKSLITAGISSKKIKLILPVVPSQKFNRIKKIEKVNLGFDENAFVALFVGNLKKNKGLDILFESFINLAPTFPNLRLLVTTELKHPNFLERKKTLEGKLFQHGLADRVVWLGFVDKIIDLISSVDVVVVPFLDLKGISDYPLVMLEAMSVGTPVIATDVGGVREVLSKNAGAVIQPGDVEALSNELSSIIGGQKNFKRDEISLDCFKSFIVGKKYQSLFTEEVNVID